jgi:beta-xylosidase
VSDSTIDPVLPVVVHPWIPDRGEGTYVNPVIHADYSDPDVIRHGDDFFMVASSFNCTPGLPVLHSTDLVNWTLVNHALQNVPHPRFRQVQPGQGVWAPAIRHHAGRFWIFFPTPDEGIYVVTAEHPTARWSEPHLVQGGRGLIDPCPLWDDDGRAWLVHAYAGSRAGIKHRLRVRPMAPDGRSLLGEGEVVFHDPEKHPTLEGPKFLKKDGWYYILAPAGGVATGWQVVLRSREVYGPYEDKVVLRQGSTAVNGPHQGALVDLPSGEWWFVHFQDVGLYGRVVHLQPAGWKDGWPVLGVNQDAEGAGEPVLRHAKPRTARPSAIAVPATSDEFDGATLGRQWQWFSNHEQGWATLAERPGWLRLRSQPVPGLDLGQAGCQLLQKFPARVFSCEALLDFVGGRPGELAGLSVMGNHHACIALRQDSGAGHVVLRVDNAVVESVPFADGRVRLRVEVADGGLCRFSWAPADGVAAWKAMGRESFQATVGGWIGAKVGLFSLADGAAPHGHADFDWFRVGP